MWIKWPSINRPIEFFSPSIGGSSFGLFSVDQIFDLSIVSIPSDQNNSTQLFFEFNYYNNPSFSCSFFFIFIFFIIIIYLI